MKLIIGEKLRRLRRERDLTQEEVASQLGISFQAISKWERGDGYPDITMLPSLANYFGITVDELIGMNEIAAQDKLDKINAKWAENRKAGLHRENAALMKEALKTYPNNAQLLVQLSVSLERLNGSESEKRANLCESIAVQERVLQYTADSEIRGAVLFNIADAYYRFGNYDKAEEYARKLPNFYKTRENALVAILKDETEKHDIAASSIERIVWSLSRQLTVLAETENDRTYLEKLLRVLDVIYEGDENDYIKAIREKAQVWLVGQTTEECSQK